MGSVQWWRALSRLPPTRFRPPTRVAIIPTGAVFPCKDKKSMSAIIVPSLPFLPTMGRWWLLFNGHASSLMLFAMISKVTFWGRLSSVLPILLHGYEKVCKRNGSSEPGISLIFFVAPMDQAGHWLGTRVIAKILSWRME